MALFKLLMNLTLSILQKREGGWGNSELRTKLWKTFGELEFGRVVVKEENGDPRGSRARSQVREQAVEELSGVFHSLSPCKLGGSLLSWKASRGSEHKGEVAASTNAVQLGIENRWLAWSCLPQAQPQPQEPKMSTLGRSTWKIGRQLLCPLMGKATCQKWSWDSMGIPVLGPEFLFQRWF